MVFALVLLLTLLATTPAHAQFPDVTQVATLTAAAASPGACVYPPAAAPSCLKLNYEGFQGVGVLITGRFVATLVAEISLDNGTTWTSVNVRSFTTPQSTVSAIQSADSYAVAAVGAGQLAQIRVATYTSGLPTVLLRATTAVPLSDIVTQGGAPWRVAVEGTPVVTQGGAPWRVALRGAPVAQITSGSNAAVSIAPGTALVASIAAYCSAGSASLTITDGGTTVWSTPSGTVTTSLSTVTWTTPLSFINSGLVQLGACGAGNTGTLSVQTAARP